ncbi:MAG: T9SS type A sorting domain-containing protein, partial [Chitinophagales bacterium]|nr:T9SS type A sorting domain-containing protein [Chitinophagales bacterium]
DADQDGFGTAADAGTAYCNPPAFSSSSNTDCNDANAAVNPSALEICDMDQIDEDCNSLSDNSDPAAIGKMIYYTDADNDGFGADTAAGIAYCHPPAGLINNNGDCDDANYEVNPSVVEFPDNNIDDNCNGLTDSADSGTVVLTLYYLDIDQDGYGDASDPGMLYVNQPAGKVEDHTDCNDTDSFINPGRVEICDANEVDENCNGLSDDIDPSTTGKLAYFIDADQDGFGAASSVASYYCHPPANQLTDHTDCNDELPAIHPGAIELCDANNVDDDCNGLADDADYAASGKNTYYTDADQDGYGSSSVAGNYYCHPPSNMVSDHSDCNDAAAAINPAASEVCDANNVDENCNGLSDDNDPVASGKLIYYTDADHDGYGSIYATGIAFCDPPAYRTTDHTDCDDASASVNTGTSEICDANNVDENCNGLSDDNDPGAAGKLLYYTDADLDGFGAATATGVAYCDPPVNIVVSHNDCNDGNAAINPSATEICDANDLDEDCDGFSDDADPSATGKILYYPDADLDGFGAINATGVAWCNQPVGKVSNHTDCNDANYSIKPGGTEICDANNLDEDCDGLSDDNDPSATGKLNYYTDADIDGYGSPSSAGILYCDPPLGMAGNQSDCNDGNAAIHPLAPEFCDINDVDENCNGLADNNDPTAIGKVVYYVDADGDNYGSSSLPGIAYCTPPSGVVTGAGDCADNNAAIKPGATEICDGIDNNCNGQIDEGLNPSNPMPVPVITPVGSTSFCYDQNVTLNAQTGFNTYSWSNGKTGQSITANTAGYITVTVKDANNCYGTSAPLNLVVWEPAEPTLTLSGPSTYCAETPSVLSTIPGYSYQWKKGSTVLTGATNQTYAPTSTSTAYKVTIADEHNCTKTSDNFSVVVNNAAVPIITAGGTTSLCAGQSVTLTATAGYNSYQWSSGQTNSVITVADAGGYTVTVVDQNGCSATSAVKTVTVNPLPTPVIAAAGPIQFCDGGSVVLDAGAGYLSYNWSNGKNTQSTTISSSGTYSVTVTNANSCSATSAPVTVTEWIPVVPTVTTSTGSSSFCANTGVYLTTNSGIAYQWSKSGTDIIGATGQNYIPTSGGSYKVVVTDEHGCQATSAAFSITILSNPVPVISGPSVICNGSTINLSCGTYSNYLWSTGATTASITTGTAGDYTVTVTDANGCVGTSASKNTALVPLPTPVITASGPIQFCDGGNVTLDAGSGYSSYSWSNGKITQTNNITASGTFTVTVTNSNNCSGTSAPVNVDEWIPPTPVISTSNGATTFCASANVYLTTVGGYSYQWQKTSIDIAGATAQNYLPTASGSYKVIITDIHGCSKTSASFSITLLSNPVPVISGPSVICNGSTINLSCGTYSNYLWSTGATTASITTGTAGNYTVTVTDANGCVGTSAVKNETIVPLPAPVITASGPIQFCDGGNVTLDAGAGYTTYSWSNGKITQTNNITASGIYTVTVTNSNNCSGTSAPVTVDEWIPPTPVISTSNGATTFCASANVYLTTVGGYSYQWQKSSVDIAGATAQNYLPTASGSYKVIITDIHGCSKTSATFTITILSNPVPVISGPSVICNGSTINLSCGTYSNYLWSTGATTASITTGTAGNYTVTVTDANGCVGTSAVKNEAIVPLPAPVITASGPIQFCDGGNVTLDAGAGYTTYSWSNGKTTQTNNITASGIYTVTVTNSNNCSGTSAPVTVEEWIPPTPTVTVVGPATFCVNNSTTYLTTLSGPYTYQWIKGSTDQAGATNQNYTPTATASYKVKITDTHGCSKTSSTVSITANSAPTASINISGSATICAGQTKTINANTGTGLTYQWKRDGNNISGATASSYVAGIAGNYTCVVTNSNGCSTTSNSITIIVNCKEDQAVTAFTNEVEWLLYPNPTNNELHISVNMGYLENGQYEIEIRNMLGSVVWLNKSSFTDHVISEDLFLDDKLAGGFYLVIINVDDNIYHSEFILTRK